MLHDPLFQVDLLSHTPNPNRVMYAALHTDYSEDYVGAEWVQTLETITEEKAGSIVVKRLLEGNRGHWGCIEHVGLVFAAGYFPHSMMQQLRTHRVGVSFDVQSFRYSGHRIIDVATGKRTVDEVFYLRPVGKYGDRQGDPYDYTEERRRHHQQRCLEAAQQYQEDVEKYGLSEEHARGLIPFDTRQHFVVSTNARSFFHIMDLRWKKDAQAEIQAFCDLAFPLVETVLPEISEWYLKNRAKKALLAP